MLTWWRAPGFCFLCGGSRYREQSFNQMINKACCSLLFIASVAIVIPTSALRFYGPEQCSDTVLRNLSHAIAILLVLLCAPSPHYLARYLQ